KLHEFLGENTLVVHPHPIDILSDLMLVVVHKTYNLCAHLGMVCQGVVGNDTGLSCAIYDHVPCESGIFVHYVIITNFEHIPRCCQGYKGQKAVDDDDGQWNGEIVKNIKVPVCQDHANGPNAGQTDRIEDGIDVLDSRMPNDPPIASRNEECQEEQDLHYGQLGP